MNKLTYLGNHTMAVQRGINMGVALFIVSEALFFLAIFWAFFHNLSLGSSNLCG
jgi:cytochrome c oxidase subunit 3